MILNCDIGERGIDHPVDRELMAWIGLANVACGGHAGTAESVAGFRELAREYGVLLSAHLSYPDREHFGRRSMQLPFSELAEALENQWSLFPEATMVKFHGALYNDAWNDAVLAGHLAEWLNGHSVTRVVCPDSSAMARAARGAGIKVLTEAFVERRYAPDAEGGLILVPRTHPDACIEDLHAALEQGRSLIQQQGVRDLEGCFWTLQADTLCIHSDSDLALDLAKSLHDSLAEEA